MPPNTQRRVILSVTDASDIRSFLVQLRKEGAELRLVTGLVEHFGTILGTDKDGFEAVFPSLTAADLPPSEPDPHPLTFRTSFRKYFYFFDTALRTSSPADRGLKLLLAWPDEIRRTSDRQLRIRPLEPATLAIPPYSPTLLRHETTSFFNLPRPHAFLLEADRILNSPDEWALASLRGNIENELRRISACDPLLKRPDRSCFRFVTRSDDSKNTLERVTEMWVQDVRLSRLPEQVKAHYAEKNIGSFVLTVVTNQFLERDAYLFLARPTGTVGISRHERDYIAALARRLYLCGHRPAERVFSVHDIGEDGLSFRDPEGWLAAAPAGSVLRDCGLSLSSSSQERLRIHLGLVRAQRDLRAARTDYPDYATRLRVRNFVESTLRLKRLSGKLF